VHTVGELIMASAATEENQEEERRIQREQEEAMEQLLLQQEGTEYRIGNEDDVLDNNEAEPEQGPHEMEPEMIAPPMPPTRSNKVSYRQASFLAAAALLMYASRTRKQYYLAAVFLSSSKFAYVIFGNALVAAAISVFDCVTGIFLQGLRLQEAEGLQDFFRWNVTETCLALTMFRSELHLSTAVKFLVLILVKCLHHTAVLREQHVRMTEDAIVAWRPLPRAHDNTDANDQNVWPVLQSGHIRLFLFLVVLQFLDLWAAQYTVWHILAHGHSVNILFSFEAAILLVSAWSHLLLWSLNVVDSMLQFGHEQNTRYHAVFRRLLHPWKEYKATFIFAVELQAQAVQFMFYLTFFSIVLTYYGVPVNLLREVYMSFAALKERLIAFFTYRQLMASMNRFQNATAEELQEAGPVCIICRDEMTVYDCKRLPVCRHIFHKSCLREWLVQQQSCPTCRSDIASMQVQEAAATAAAQREAAVVPLTPATGTEEEDQLTESQSAPDPLHFPPNVDEEERIGRGKQVQFTFEASSVTTRHFPALYKVTKEGGAPVFGNDGTPFRTVPQGSMILCQRMKMHLEGQIITPQLRIPDGWVAEDCLAHVLNIPSSKIYSK
jgi:E3 ubiquitin-protein ligase synoviolin